MITFIDVNVYDGSNVFDKPSKTSLSFSDKTYPDRLCIVGTLPHNSEISFDKVNAQKVIDFLQKNIIDVPEVQKNNSNKV